MKGFIDPDTVAMLLALTAEQIASKEITDVNLHVRDQHGHREDWSGRVRPGSTTRRRIVTITLSVEGAHGDAWYHASAGQAMQPNEIAQVHGLPEPEPKPKRIETTAGPWTCGHCGHMNGKAATSCRRCGK